MDTEKRITNLESDMATVKSHTSRFEEVIVQHSLVLEGVSKQIESSISFMKTMLEMQRDSLPIGLVMKMFTYFCGVIIALIGAILGLGWAFNLPLFK